MKFDTKSESPKLHFAPTRWLTDDEYGTIKDQADSEEATKAVGSSAAATDGVKAAPLAIAGKPPAKAAPAPVVDEDEDDAPAPAPVAKPAAKKAKPAPAPVVEEDTAPEPEVRKAAPKATAVPAGKASLADIVSDWDDE
jgi:hypothetical protein